MVITKLQLSLSIDHEANVTHIADRTARSELLMNFPSQYELLNQQLSDDEVASAISSTIEYIGNESFQRWYHAEKFVENIRNGQSYFNGPSESPNPLRHTPSQLLQCSRKIYYRKCNAPEENIDPSGIFWVGENVETELIVPYLQAVACEGIYVQNSIWFDFKIKSPTGPLHFKGETDPVFVDSTGAPVLLTEVKTRNSVNDLNSPSDHHLAQAHVYMYGLSQKYDRKVTEAMFIYVDRTTLSLKVFHCEFDPVFWRNQALDWAAKHSKHLIGGRLPPAEPEYGWECEFCSYRKRCGKDTDVVAENSPAQGFVPLHEYPEKSVTIHLEANKKQGLKMTPTLANRFPHLADEFGAYDWHCQSCGDTLDWQTINIPEMGESVRCPSCEEESVNTSGLRGPTPAEQEEIDDE